jgi:hypothetical protein
MGIVVWAIENVAGFGAGAARPKVLDCFDMTTGAGFAL